MTHEIMYRAPKLEHALALREAVLGGSHRDVAACLYSLADVLSDLEDFERAVTSYQRALAIQEQTLGEHPMDVARTLNGLAIVYDSQGLFSQLRGA